MKPKPKVSKPSKKTPIKVAGYKPKPPTPSEPTSTSGTRGRA